MAKGKKKNSLDTELEKMIKQLSDLERFYKRNKKKGDLFRNLRKKYADASR